MQDHFSTGGSDAARLVQAIILPPYQDSAVLSKGIAAGLEIIRRYWWLLAAATFLGAVSLTAATYLLPKVYRAEAILAPTQTSGGQAGPGSLLGRYGGLASAIGVDVSTTDAETNEAIATIKSRAFLGNFVSDKKLLPVLFPGGRNKSVQDAYQLLTRSILAVEHDKATSLVTVSVEWTDRQLAAEWANELVARVNETMRQRAIRISDANLHYLREEWSESQPTSLRDTASSLMEAQLNTRMLATTQPDYAFRVIDPASPPDANKSVRPKRIVFALLGAIIGGLVCFMMCVLQVRRKMRPVSN